MKVYLFFKYALIGLGLHLIRVWVIKRYDSSGQGKGYGWGEG